MIYVVVGLLLIVFTYIHDVLGIRKNRELDYFIAFMILFLLAGLRLGMGGDTYQYRIFWELLPSWETVTWDKLTDFRYSIGWTSLCFILKTLFGSFISLQLVLSFLINYAFFSVAGKYSKYPFMIILMFYLAGDQYFHIVFTFMRQSASVAVFLIWGVKYLESRNFVKYAISVAIAASMHFGGLILIVLPIIWYVENIKKKYLYLLIFVGIAFIGFVASISDSDVVTGIRLLDRINSGMESVDEKVEENEIKRVFNKTHLLILYYMVILYGVWILHIKVKFKGALIFGFFVCVLGPYLGDSMRFLQYLIIFYSIAVADVFSKLIRRNFYIYLIVISGYTISSNLLFYKRYTDPEKKFFFYPYISCFEDEPMIHKRYFIYRLNDGHTVSHQIYDYNKFSGK